VARPGFALLGCLVCRKVRARVSALRFSWALIEQRKRNKPPFRNRLGSLAAIGLVLARCAGCSAFSSLCSVQCSAGRCAMLGGWGVCCTMPRAQCRLCSRSEALKTMPRAQCRLFACCDRPCLVSLCSVQCSAGRCAMLERCAVPPLPAALGAAQYPRLPLRSASPAKGLLPRERNAVQC